MLVGYDRKIISTGYNGAPSGLTHCFGEGCRVEGSSCVNSIHAEANAFVRANEVGKTLYCTDTPCINCLKLALAHNPEIEIVWQRLYVDVLRDRFLELHPQVAKQLRTTTKEENKEIEQLSQRIREF